MATYTQILYHVVFATKQRLDTIPNTIRRDLYGYIRGTLDNNACVVYEIGGTGNHVHILFALHPNETLAEMIKKVKVASTGWLKDDNHASGFDCWQEGYGAFTVSHPDKESVMRYIQRQEEHHREVDFLTEFRDMLERAGIDYDPKYLP